jgi:hypothetical protein
MRAVPAVFPELPIAGDAGEGRAARRQAFPPAGARRILPRQALARLAGA